MQRRFRPIGSITRIAVVVMAIVVAHANGTQAASVMKIYGFKDPALGFRAVSGYLTAGPGVLYGYASSGLTESGTYIPGGLFELVPPTDGNGPWVSHTLLLSPKDQSFELPLGGPLLLDVAGNLFGETTSDGPAFAGTVFELSPPAAGSTKWTFRNIFTFRAARQGAYPTGGLTAGPNGVLYGTAQAGGHHDDGVVFSLTPPASAGDEWTETVLWRFGLGKDGSVPYGAPALGPGGEVYGVTGYGGVHGMGRVFMLTPPAAGASTWQETVLHDFAGTADGATPYAGLVRDAAGTLYGIASTSGPDSYGTAYALQPPASGDTAWSFTLLHAFSGMPDAYSPQQPLVIQTDGSLIGISMYGGNYVPSFDGVGAIFKLTPPAVGQTAWSEKVIYNFGDLAATVGELPGSALTSLGGALFGTTTSGGPDGHGAAFELQP